jgi:hypothetical protein
MQITVDQAHGAVPRALADIIAVLPVCRRWDTRHPSALGTTAMMMIRPMRTMACSLPVTRG